MKKLFYFVVLAIGIAGIAIQLLLLQRQREASAPLENLGGTVQLADMAAPDGSLPKFSSVPQFALTERNGGTMTREDLKGKVWIADFIFTKCPDVCPMLSSRLAGLQQAAMAAGAANGGDEVRFVSFSVDPENDTPAVLKEYASHVNAGDKWLFLTGDKAQVRRIALEGFLLGFENTPGVENGITHSTKIALVDRQGAVRRFYDGIGADESEKILADLKTLLKE